MSWAQICGVPRSYCYLALVFLVGSPTLGMTLCFERKSTLKTAVATMAVCSRVSTVRIYLKSSVADFE